jgi:FKBP-type peptidyl-prolyl cis-trans isomerase
LFAAAACVAALTACGSSVPTSPTAVAFSQTDLRLGTGAAAASGDKLNVTYTGWLYDASRPDYKGIVFDSNAGGTPFSFTLGGGQVIAGWDQGLAGLKVGGIRRLIVPAALGYGGTRFGYIPPNTALVFEVELLSIGDSSQ